MGLSPDGIKIMREFPKVREEAALYHRYMKGEHETSWGSDSYKTENSWAIKKSITNICPAVIEAFTTGLTVNSFTKPFDELAQLEIEQEISRAFREAWSTGNGYLLAYKDGQSKGLIHQNSETIVPIVGERVPSLRFVGKVWTETEKDRNLTGQRYYLEIYYPDKVVYFRTYNTHNKVPDSSAQWEYIDEWSHGFPEIPFIWFRLESASKYSRGESALKPVLLIQDRHNKNASDWTVTNDKAARQLVALMEKPGEVEDEFALAFGGLQDEELYDSPESEASEAIKLDTNATSFLRMKADAIHQLQPPTTAAFSSAREAIYGDISAVTGIPSHFLRGTEIQNSSFENTVFLSSRILQKQKKFITDNKLELARMLMLLGYGGLPVFDIENVQRVTS